MQARAGRAGLKTWKPARTGRPRPRRLRSWLTHAEQACTGPLVLAAGPQEEAAPHGPERRPGGRPCRGSLLLQCYVAQILFHGASCPQIPTFLSQAIQVRHKPDS